MTRRVLLAVAAAAAMVASSSAAQDAERLVERAHQDREIVYFLRDPATHAFDLFHDFTETREGTSQYLNVVRQGSTVSNPSARVLDTGEVLKTEILRGPAISAAGIDVGEPVRPDSEVVVVRFPAVARGASLRLRISETYTDPARYRLDGEELLWDRTFSRPRNAVVLPLGWVLTASSIPATVSETGDGRIRLDFVNPRPDEIAVLIRARRRLPRPPAAGTGAPAPPAAPAPSPMTRAAIPGAAAAAPPPAPPANGQRPQAGWVGLLGSGLFTLPDTHTAPPRRFVVGITVDNRDRDPLGIDQLDGALAWSVGLSPRLETYGRIVASRVVTVPGRRLPLPPPPVDVIVPSSVEPPRRPYYPLFSQIPYVNDRGKARFSAFVPGDVILGGKIRLLEQRGRRPSVAVAAEITVPMPYGLVDLQSGGGTGTVDIGARGLAEWRLGHFDVVTSALFVRTGSTPYGDRLVTVGPMDEEGVSPARVDDMPLRIPNRLELGVGARRAFRPWVAAVVEASTSIEIGYRSRALDRVAPVDLLAGAQLARGRARLTAALRYHGNALRSGVVRPSPLAGAVDLTDVGAQDLAEYLRQTGTESALRWLRGRTQRVLVSPPADTPLPPGARVVPAQYEITSEHQVGFLVALGWAF